MLLPDVKVYQMGRNTKTDAAPPEKKCPYCAGSIEMTAFRCPKCTSWLDFEMYASLEDQKARRLNDGGNGNSYEAETWKEKQSLGEHDIVVSSLDHDGRNHFEQ